MKGAVYVLINNAQSSNKIYLCAQFILLFPDVYNKMYMLYELCVCVLVIMCWSVNLNLIVEALSRCKAHLVRLTAKVQIRPILLVGIDWCEMHINKEVVRIIHEIKENHSGREQWSFELDSSKPETTFLFTVGLQRQYHGRYDLKCKKAPRHGDRFPDPDKTGYCQIEGQAGLTPSDWWVYERAGQGTQLWLWATSHRRP